MYFPNLHLLFNACIFTTVKPCVDASSLLLTATDAVAVQSASHDPLTDTTASALLSYAGFF
jgi:hypothetical protein